MRVGNGIFTSSPLYMTGCSIKFVYLENINIQIASAMQETKKFISPNSWFSFEYPSQWYEFEDGEDPVVGEYTSNLAVPCDVKSISGSLSESGKEYLKAEIGGWGEFEITVDTHNVPPKKKGKTVRLPITFKFGDGYKDETYTINVKLPN